jgi:hypothetical protein
MKCISCGTIIEVNEKSSVFPCPNCAKVQIARCGRCKKLVRPYTCEECGFTGP